MQNWDVFLILAEIVAFISVILSFSSKFNQTLGEFRAVISQLKETVANMQTNSRDTHKTLFKKIDEHETRISRLEKGK